MTSRMYIIFLILCGYCINVAGADSLDSRISPKFSLTEQDFMEISRELYPKIQALMYSDMQINEAIFVHGEDIRFCVDSEKSLLLAGTHFFDVMNTIEANKIQNDPDSDGYLIQILRNKENSVDLLILPNSNMNKTSALQKFIRDRFEIDTCNEFNRIGNYLNKTDASVVVNTINGASDMRKLYLKSIQTDQERD